MSCVTSEPLCINPFLLSVVFIDKTALLKPWPPLEDTVKFDRSWEADHADFATVFFF
jgi:hypothetical protein